ncbi:MULTISPECIES: TIGR03085 family metal-binding protein [unclassified Janibacter]|uniref:TIGR03085 family metal-binding protein n=1 Tax=unclassified Janibacter TaxID=2649294 RepID=UPI003D03CEEB
MTDHAAAERAALCDTFDRVGPTAPTLSGEWLTRDLAAHLVIRESRPLDAVGTFVPLLADRTDAAISQLATGTAWPSLVERVRKGPPGWWPTAWVPGADELVNTAEFYVHHEDVLRAQRDWTARDVDPGLERALWAMLTKGGRFLFRRARTGIVLDSGTARTSVKGATDLGTVVLAGPPSELTLFAFGRQRVAHVECRGTEEQIAAVLDSRLDV